MSRPILLLIIFLLIKSLYVPLNRRPSRYYWKLPIDDRIPLIPFFSLPYLGYFLYIALSVILLWNTVYINTLFFALILSYLIAIPFWFFFPNGVKRPIITKTSLFDRILGFLYRADEDTNGFPSAHVFVTLICTYVLAIAGVDNIWLSWTAAALIILSTLFTKQHYILDIAGGIIVFVLSISLYL